VGKYQWKSATIGDLSKLLGSPFGLKPKLHVVEQFLVNRVKGKLKDWSSTNLSVWWREEYQGLHFNIIMSKAYTLNMNCLRYFKDIWDPKRYDFLIWEDAKH
jgi:hypothetical protein